MSLPFCPPSLPLPSLSPPLTLPLPTPSLLSSHLLPPPLRSFLPLSPPTSLLSYRVSVSHRTFFLGLFSLIFLSSMNRASIFKSFESSEKTHPHTGPSREAPFPSCAHAPVCTRPTATQRDPPVPHRSSPAPSSPSQSRAHEPLALPGPLRPLSAQRSGRLRRGIWGRAAGQWGAPTPRSAPWSPPGPQPAPHKPGTPDTPTSQAMSLPASRLPAARREMSAGSPPGETLPSQPC